MNEGSNMLGILLHVIIILEANNLVKVKEGKSRCSKDNLLGEAVKPHLRNLLNSSRGTRQVSKHSRIRMCRGVDRSHRCISGR